MKLQDALKKIIREFGMSVLREKRLVFLLSDYKAFDDYPAVKQIMKSIAEDGYGKELCRLGMDGNSEECLNYAGRLKKTLSCDKHFKPELTDYAVDCILSVMGLVSYVNEPSEHGFDPFGNNQGHQEHDHSSSNGERSGHRWNSDTTSPHTDGNFAYGNNATDSGSSGAQASADGSSAQPIISDRIGRMEFWCTQICAFIVSVIVSVLLSIGFFIGAGSSDPEAALIIIYDCIIPSCLCIIPPCLPMFRKAWQQRAHDLGLSGNVGIAFAAYFSLSYSYIFVMTPLNWWFKILLFVGPILLGLSFWKEYGFDKGAGGSNQYGPAPARKRQTKSRKPYRLWLLSAALVYGIWILNLVL